MLLALVANPKSGWGAARTAEWMLRERGAEVRSFGLDERDDAVALGPDRMVVAGGDGSVGFAAEAAARAGVPLAVVPVGTANDFARAVGIPLDLAEACRVAAEGRETRMLELGWMRDRPFVNIASAGLAPIAAAKAQGVKRILGPFAYSLGALRAGITAQPIGCRVTCDGEALFDRRAWQVSVAVTGAFGGGSRLDADPHDGVLDVVVIEATSRARLAIHAYGVRAGRIENHPGVITGAGREVEVEPDRRTDFNVDGELVDADEVRCTVEARAFEIVVG